MKFAAQYIGSGLCGVWDGGVMRWKAVDLGENVTVPVTMAALILPGWGVSRL
jgi:hypothetical protein